MARKTVLVCDKCGAEVEEGKGAVMRVTFNDARRGAKAADLPVEQPSKYDLTINLKTAKAIGVTIPQSMLLRANDVIQ